MKGRWGVHKIMNIITKGEGVHNSIALCNKVHEGGARDPYAPLDPLLVCVSVSDVCVSISYVYLCLMSVCLMSASDVCVFVSDVHVSVSDIYV